ncbi:VapE domain-containing protein [Cupriavidus pauculus]|uniref:Virulence-associated protein E-like domain-containing protein n=1 Tax=Cupriavidus pauculus TaxID=82633 RepID=A0A2N5C9J2_9BURK|nr:VapE domain-containing protein [Cupriavidus pauculus]PLP98893.1 hypothetical protein CYJ10_19080 [Cupriavidus pauculus]
MAASNVGGNENIEHTGAPVDGEVDTSPWGEEDEYAGMLEHGRREEQKAVLRLADNKLRGEEAAALARLEPDLVKRAKALKRLGAFDFPEEKPVNNGGMVVMRASKTDLNFWAFYDAMFGTELPSRPHFDTFRGAPVDHTGNEFDARSPIMEMVKAVKAAEIHEVSAEDIRRTYREWMLNDRMNDLAHNFSARIPQWDGKSRLDTFLFQYIGAFDNDTNRAFGKYFWLSLYNRITDPGCFAPMALALFGRQGSGKSNIGRMICKEVVGPIVGPKAETVPMNLGVKTMNPFLRAITGKSIIANVGEMTGFGRADINFIKDFMTRANDLMDQKYEKHIGQPRQWIVMMDSNKYEGLQRDDTGNRRFYPMFVGQLPDKDGQPQWSKDFTIKEEMFNESFWQIMAECREWMKTEGGGDGYKNMVEDVSELVLKFNDDERAMDRGTVHDPELEDAFVPGLLKCRMRYVKKRDGSGRGGVRIDIVDLNKAIMSLYTTSKGPQKNHLDTKLTALGGEFAKDGKGTFVWIPCDNIDAFVAKLNSGGEEYEDTGEVRHAVDENRGF